VLLNKKLQGLRAYPEVPELSYYVAKEE